MEIIAPCLSALWLFGYQYNPIVHRTTFDNAFRLGMCPIYGAAPYAIRHALVASGMRFATNIVGTAAERDEWTNWHLERAVELLELKYFNEHPTITDIEAIQVILLVFYCGVSAGLGARYLPLLERGVDVAIKACVSGPLPASEGLFPPPNNHIEWIHDEMRMRCWIAFVNLDVVYAYHYTGQQHFIDYTAYPFRLPASEHYFDWTQSDVAFHLLQTEQTASGRFMLLDFDCLFINGDAEARARHVSQAVSPIFTRGRSLHALSSLVGLLRLRRIHVRQFATEHGIVPFLLAGKICELPEPQTDSILPAEAQYLDMSLRIEEIFILCRDALPLDLATAVANGDARAILDKALFHFEDVRRAHAFIQLCVVLASVGLENWMDDEVILRATFMPPQSDVPVDPDCMLKFLASPIFRRMFEAAIICARLLHGQLAADPTLNYSHVLSLQATMRLGAFYLAAWKMQRTAMAMDPVAGADPVCFTTIATLERDIKVIAAWLIAIGGRFSFANKFADVFGKLMVDAGIVSSPDGTPVDGTGTIADEM